MQADHPAATAPRDLALVDATLALPEAQGFTPTPAATARAVNSIRAVSTVSAISAVNTVNAASAVNTLNARSLFSTTPMLPALDLDAADIDALFGPARRHEEREHGTLLSFFHGEHSHVVLRAKELQVQRPHGHILRSGAHLVPDETALTSTTWMAGVFHSMVTQGHVSINRFLSTVHSLLGLFR